MIYALQRIIDIGERGCKLEYPFFISKSYGNKFIIPGGNNTNDYSGAIISSRKETWCIP